jgi:hypothetical protein
MQHAVWFRIPPKHDAPDFTSAAATRGCDDMLAVLSAIEPFDLPDIGFDSCILQGANGLKDERRAHEPIVRSIECIEAIPLRRRRGHE